MRKKYIQKKQKRERERKKGGTNNFKNIFSWFSTTCISYDGYLSPGVTLCDTLWCIRVRKYTINSQCNLCISNIHQNTLNFNENLMFYFGCGEDIFVAHKTATKARLVLGNQLASRDQQKALSMSSKLLDFGYTISSRCKERFKSPATLDDVVYSSIYI